MAEFSKRKIMVTGGSGLVGKAIEEVVQHGSEKREDEEWIFLSSKDGDLRFVIRTKFIALGLSILFSYL